MALPKIDVPIFNVKLISTGKSVRFRPFSVKEEKLFLMANESEDVDTALDAVKQVLNNCVLDEIDIQSLPLFDIENLFLNLRARSVGEQITLRYKCNNDVEVEGENKKCGHIVEMDVNILGIEPENNPAHDKKIPITENLGIVMKYPSLQMLKDYEAETEVDAIINMAASCIDYIYDTDNIYYAKDTPKEELVEFIENLQSRDLEKIKNFFETMPKIKKSLDFKCKKCGHEEVITIEGIESFFV